MMFDQTKQEIYNNGNDISTRQTNLLDGLIKKNGCMKI